MCVHCYSLSSCPGCMFRHHVALHCMNVSTSSKCGTKTNTIVACGTVTSECTKLCASQADQVSARQAKHLHGRHKVGIVCGSRGKRLTLIAACMILVAALVSLSTGSNPGNSQDMFMLAFMLYAYVHACKQVLPVLAQNSTDTMCQKVLMAQESRVCLLIIVCNHLQLQSRAEQTGGIPQLAQAISAAIDGSSIQA